MSESKIFISIVPAEFECLVKLYVENIKVGGGQYETFCYDDKRQMATVEFKDDMVAKHFVELKSIDILNHQMPVTAAPSDCTIFIYNVDDKFKDDLDCVLESPKKGGGRIVKLNYHEEFKCLEVVFEKKEIVQNFIKKGFVELTRVKFPTSELPPCLYEPKPRVKVVKRIVLIDDVLVEKSTSHDNSNISSTTTTECKKHHSIEKQDDDDEEEKEEKNDDDDGDDDEEEEEEEENDDNNANANEIELEAFNLSESLNEKNLCLILKNKKYGGALKSYKFDCKGRIAHFAFEEKSLNEDYVMKGQVKINGQVFFSIRKINL